MRALLAACAALALAGPAAAQAAAPEVRAVVTAAVQGGETRLELRLVTAAGVPAVGSFQGEMRLPAGAGTVSGGDFAPGVVGAWNQVEPGRVRFAGVATQGLGDGPALVLRLPGTVAAAGVGVVLEEAVGADGFRKLVVGRPAQAQPLEDE